MTNSLAVAESREIDAIKGDELDDYVTFVVADQLFGIPVLQVQDILTPDRIASIPLAPPQVKGSINLRGRIVTVIDVRTCLGLPKLEDDSECMGVTVEHHNELYTLLVDGVGDVVSLAADIFESNPSTLDPLWREFANGVFRLDKRLMVVLDVDRILDIKQS
ncbi:MAG: chemotaxis protein CheW [Magnetovibrionaceae bacterium]